MRKILPSMDDAFLVVLLGLLSVFGDFLVLHTKVHLFRAIFDNATHGIVGGISWLIVCLHTKKMDTKNYHYLIDIAQCSLLSSAIDLDHFLAAKSFYLKDATSLKRRPPLHCTSFPLLFVTFLLILSYLLQITMLKKISLLILTAFLSHHTRDATRRGYWLYPFGSTPPIPYIIYVIITCLIPYFVCYLYQIVLTESGKMFKSIKGIDAVI